MFFSDVHIQILARGILQPGEQVVGQTVTSYMPWWAFGLVRRQHVVIATDQRIVVLDHRYDLLKVNQVLHCVDSIPWSSVQHVKVSGLLFKKKLKLRGTSEQGKQINISAKIPSSFLPAGTVMKNNMLGAKSLAAAHQALASGQPPLLAHGGHAQLPALNAPGYVSAPPPASSQYGAPPTQSPFVPRQY